ncbi:hypothetical protein AGABI2DRAFT_178619 [Agaricus bisporus var. bisporus H97]|uniref:hypothetical protein n=1 Tax=Agaricus bisporus var. bisporus (strain H97 / ATCC MYA-4626 / FGSC 10389) TaxID=936046 RepID=UPI00029F6622|nr:hypothetical protein AGABI2DRAFT_178619 [Agaricus bisporus var. bisporus H97]EKV47820.1 hypothetical protein AGABI2DRAFT_178619 [Agaricus bisporus var. bisporus H97]
MPTAVERSQSPRGSHHSVDESAARLKRISSSDRLHLLRAWNEMDLHFKEGSVDYLWLFYTAFYSAKGANRKEQCYVAKLAIWKERSSFSHEYLVVTVKSVHDDIREQYLLFERTVGELNREGAREEKLDGEEKRRRRGRGEKRIIDAVNMPERLWEAHTFGGNATRQRDLSDEEDTGNDTWRMTVKSLISDASESSSANLILADDRYQVLDKPYRNPNDVHIASLILKKPYHDDDDEEAPKTTADPSVPKSPTAQEPEQTEKISSQEVEQTEKLSSQEAAQVEKMPSLEARQTEKSPLLKADLPSHEAEQTEKLPSPVAPDNPEENDHPSADPKSDAPRPPTPMPQHPINALWSSPLVERQFSAESDSSLLLEQNITSNLDCDQSVLERASVSAPDITTARLSPHYFASQLPRGGFDDDWEVDSSRGTIFFESGSERVSFRTNSPGSTRSFRSDFSAPVNQNSSVYGTPVLPYGLIEDSQHALHEYLNQSPTPHEDTSQHRILTPVRRSRTSIDQLSYVQSEVDSVIEPEVKPTEVDPPISDTGQEPKSLLFDSHEGADNSRLPVLELKTLPEANQDPIEVSSSEPPRVQVLQEEEPPLSPLENEPLSPEQHPTVEEEISMVPRSTEYLPLGRVPSHASSDSKKSTSSRVSRHSVRSLFSIHSDTIPPMPSRKYVFLFELVALAVRLHKCKSLYRLFTKNCYWFVGVMFHVIRNFCQIDVSIDDKDGKPDVMKPDDEVTIWVNSGRMGRFLHAIKIMKAPRLFTIQALKRKWQASNARFTAQMSVIQHAVNREEVRQIRRAQREREIQHRLNELKKREEARADEERKRHIEEIKEERKRYEEALKKKEEEAKRRYEEEAKKKEEEAKKKEEEAKKRYEEEARKKEEEAKKRYEEEAKKKEEEAKKREDARVEEERKRYEEELRKREEEARRAEEERKALLEELMRYRESETKKTQI